jgi:hypothetical protein
MSSLSSVKAKDFIRVINYLEYQLHKQNCNDLRNNYNYVISKVF